MTVELSKIERLESDQLLFSNDQISLSLTKFICINKMNEEQFNSWLITFLSDCLSNLKSNWNMSDRVINHPLSVL